MLVWPMDAERNPDTFREKEQKMFLQLLFPSPRTGYHSRMEKARAPLSGLGGKPSFRLTFSMPPDKFLLHDCNELTNSLTLKL